MGSSILSGVVVSVVSITCRGTIRNFASWACISSLVFPADQAMVVTAIECLYFVFGQQWFMDK